MATAADARGAGPERAFADPLPASGSVVLSPSESAHLVRVRRVAVGDEVALFDGRGTTRRARLVKADPGGATLLVLGEAPARRPTRELTLAVSPPETSRADDLVAELAWLGVACWVPLLCARTEAGREALVERRRERWSRLALEAAKGNGGSRLLRVAPTQRFETLLAAPPSAGLVLLDPDPQAPPLTRLLSGRPELPWLLVGPEGGFTPGEVQAAFTSGAASASLGAMALRTEIAAKAAAAQALGLP